MPSNLIAIEFNYGIKQIDEADNNFLRVEEIFVNKSSQESNMNTLCLKFIGRWVEVSTNFYNAGSRLSSLLFHFCKVNHKLRNKKLMHSSHMHLSPTTTHTHTLYSIYTDQLL